MRVCSIALTDYRNYIQESVSFSPEMNLIYGSNGAGKTNLLEGIYSFSLGRGFRGNGREVIRIGCEMAKIHLDFVGQGRDQTSDIQFLKGAKKRIWLNEIELKRTSELIGRFICVLFTPDEMTLVKGAPDGRRRWLDSAMIPLRPRYLMLLNQYQLVMKQKMALFRSQNTETLHVWNEKQAEIGTKITMLRQSYLDRIAPWAGDMHQQLSGGKESLVVSYAPSAKIYATAEETKSAFLERLLESREREMENRMSFVGPHRDDIHLTINEKSARSYASQGQQRTAVLSLKTAQMEIINEETGEYPVLLLDDMMSELDGARRAFLMEKIRGKQVILTCTDRESAGLPGSAAMIAIDGGRLGVK